AVSQPEIKDVIPAEAKKGEQIDLRVTGSGFRLPKTVRLVRSKEEMVCTEILSGDTIVHCRLLIDKEPGEKWDVVVENEDGKQARKDAVFSITQASQDRTDENSE